MKLVLCFNTIIQRGHNWVTGLILCWTLLNENLCYVGITHQYTISRISSVKTVTASKMKSNEPLEVLFQTFDVIGL